jgi:F-type H+-transporting ATPase subunit gamma
MPSLRDIRRRIRSVGSIQQITRAMEMVATTKLRRVQNRAQALRPFTLEMQTMVKRLVAIAPPGSSPFVRPAPAAGETQAAGAAGAPPIGLLVVTSDRGLCGAHNTNVLATVHRFLRERGLETATSRGPDLKGKVALYVVGRKGYSYFTRRGYEIAHYIADPVLEKMTFRDVVVIAKGGARDFLAGKVSEIHIVSTRFESMVSFKPEVNPWLPIRPPEANTKETPAGKESANAKEAGEKFESIDAIVQPSVPALLETLLPKYLAVRLANLMLEALTSEFASRRVSMKNATDAADDLRKGLQRVYNRARQESITKQLLEIVGGAEALR